MNTSTSVEPLDSEPPKHESLFDGDKENCAPAISSSSVDSEPEIGGSVQTPRWKRAFQILKKFAGFLGPGIMVAVAYMDPGNYSTDVSGGAQFQYKMLSVILISTIVALYLQILAIRLGSITGRDLAENCRDHFHKYGTWFVWILAEAAIMSTDVAEVAGVAIALNVLGNVPLMAGVFISFVDVLLILAFYGREMGMTALRILEIIVTGLTLVIIVCFCIIMGRIPKADVAQVFYGYVPSSVLVSSAGIPAAAGILGATVMPHSLYLGSAQSILRVRAVDMKHGKEVTDNYRPSRYAVRSTLVYATVEMVCALVTMALFVNSAILVVAGDAMYGRDSVSADLFSLNDTLREYLGGGVAIIFYVALLASGLSSSVICTMAGQIVSEGHINWRTKPWIRRIVTRVVTLIPCIVVVATMGKSGISTALNWSQIVLTITLPFLATPLVYLTSRKTVMRKEYANGWISMAFGAVVCIFLVITNVYLLVEVGRTGEMD